MSYYREENVELDKTVLTNLMEVKDMMTSDKVLCNYDPNEPVYLACDASG